MDISRQTHTARTPKDTAAHIQDLHTEPHQPSPEKQSNFNNVAKQDAHKISSSPNKKTSLTWKSKEYEKGEENIDKKIVIVAILSIIILYALFTNSPIMAITFILIGVVIFLLAESDPKEFTFSITSEGVQINNSLYLFENISSVWFFEDEDPQKLFLELKSGILRRIFIPLKGVTSADINPLIPPEIPRSKPDPRISERLSELI